MILAWWIFFGALAVCIAGLVVGVAGEGRPWADPGWVFAGVAALVAFIFLIAAPIVSLERHYGRLACRTFAAQTARQTRFVIYTAWDGGDCLTPDGSGHWIPTKNLREFGSKP